MRRGEGLDEVKTHPFVMRASFPSCRVWSTGGAGGCATSEAMMRNRRDGVGRLQGSGCHVTARVLTAVHLKESEPCCFETPANVLIGRDFARSEKSLGATVSLWKSRFQMNL